MNEEVNPPEIRSHEATIPQMDGDIVFVELCARSPVLNAMAQEKGLRIFPVDCSRNRHTTHAKVHVLDLTLDSSWDSLYDLAKNYKVATWHFGWPYGTCSKARGIPLEDGSPGTTDSSKLGTSHMGVPDMSQSKWPKLILCMGKHRSSLSGYWIMVATLWRTPQTVGCGSCP